MWYRALVVTGFCGIMMVTNGCAVTSSCGGGCGECGGGFPTGGFSGGHSAGPLGLPPVSGHLDGCGCGVQHAAISGCAAPGIGCGCNGAGGPACSCGGNCGCGGGQYVVSGGPTCAAPAGCSTCPTCTAPLYGGVPLAAAPLAPPPVAPALAPAPAPAPVINAQPIAPQNVYPPPVNAVPTQPYSVPLGVPSPVQSAPAAAAPAATSPPSSAPAEAEPGKAGDVPIPDGFEDPDAMFDNPDARYYRQPRTIRPVNAVPMGNGYYIQQQSGQIPMHPVRGRQVPMRRVKQMSGDDLPVFHLD